MMARKISEKNTDDALARARGVRAPNLALKAKVTYHKESSLVEEEEILRRSPEDMKYAHVEHMALAQRAFMKKWKSSSPSKPKATSRVRTCYNCGHTNQFIAECPYERVEDHNGRLVRKEMKSKSYPRNSDKKRDLPTHALITQEEYLSGDDASDNEEIGRCHDPDFFKNKNFIMHSWHIAFQDLFQSFELYSSKNIVKCLFPKF
jgi:hypothetical protein